MLIKREASRKWTKKNFRELVDLVTALSALQERAEFCLNDAINEPGCDVECACALASILAQLTIACDALARSSEYYELFV